MFKGIGIRVVSPAFLAAFFAFPCFAQSLPPAPPANPIDRLAEIGPAISRCWRQPEGSVGMELTIAFTFNRKGEVFGKPRITHSKLAGGAPLQKEFVAAALKAIGACTPLPFTDALGGAVAGRPFTMRFVGMPLRKPEQGI